MDGRPGYCLQFDYDAALIEELKSSIPHTDREWDPVTKKWWISTEYETELDKLFPGFLEFVHAQQRMF